MIRRLVFSIPLISMLALTSLIFLGARAPRTWAAHWAPPARVSPGAGDTEFGSLYAVHHGWDTLWVDDNRQQLVFSPAHSNVGSNHPLVLDTGEVLHPSLIRVGSVEAGVWIRNLNGITQLRAAIIEPVKDRRVYTLAFGSAPIEHPFLFRSPEGGIDVVFSWQRDGNYDIYLGSIPISKSEGWSVRRLTRAQYYDFYPRAAVDGAGNIGLLYLQSCCKQEQWNVVYATFDSAGRPLQQTRVLTKLLGFGVNRQIPPQWGEDLQRDSRGALWGAFAADGGVWVFRTGIGGRVSITPRNLDDLPGLTPAVSLSLNAHGGILFWEQPHDLGTYIESRRFDVKLTPMGESERVAYESGSQSYPHATMGSSPHVLWHTVSRALVSRFETSIYRSDVRPNIAQRLGLGLGDPWEEAAVLIVATLSVATLVTTTNLLLVIAMAVCGMITMRLFRKVPGRWNIYGAILTFALFVTFVKPGAPVLFLSTIPAMGLAVMPFGVLATLGALTFVTWSGYGALRRIDDVYRAGIMAFLGVYFFAFLETIVFVQQRLGYI
ncbi:MAG: hypothetical protein NVSMB52_03130 [Chloroflexota bacterium]